MAWTLSLKADARSAALAVVLQLGDVALRLVEHHAQAALVTLAEIVYLAEKQRFGWSVYADVKAALEDPEHVLQEVPFTVEIVEVMRGVPRAEVPDMPDRIVAATALHLGVPVISRDAQIRASTVLTVW